MLVVERFGQVQTSTHASPEQAMVRLDGPAVEDRNRKARARQTGRAATCT